MSEQSKLTPLPWSWADARPVPGLLDGLAAERPVVWLAKADAGSAGATDLPRLLSAAERDRWERFRLEADRRRFVAGRAMVRLLAAAHSRQPPERVPLAYGPLGKPALAVAGSPVPFHFNLSHSGNCVLLAVHRTREVGVDVEQVRPDQDWDDVARRFFPADEYGQWAASTVAERVALFFKLWTRREAGLKALGVGIGQPDQAVNNLTYFELELPAGYAGSVALV